MTVYQKVLCRLWSVLICYIWNFSFLHWASSLLVSLAIIMMSKWLDLKYIDDERLSLTPFNYKKLKLNLQKILTHELGSAHNRMITVYKSALDSCYLAAEAAAAAVCAKFCILLLKLWSVSVTRRPRRESRKPTSESCCWTTLTEVCWFELYTIFNTDSNMIKFSLHIYKERTKPC